MSAENSTTKRTFVRRAVTYTRENPTIVLLLVVIMIFAIYTRSYHANYPIMGYHNMKETVYFSEAYHYVNYGEWGHTRNFFEDSGDTMLDPNYHFYESLPQIPIPAYLTALVWFITGPAEWVGRFWMITFFALSIPILFFTVKRLAKNNFIALTSAFLYSLMPLGIYFGRNVQPEGIGLFFIILSFYLYVGWLDFRKWKHLLYAGLMLSVSALIKPTHLIVVIPMFFILPFKEFKDTKFLKQFALYAGGGLFLFILGMIYIKSIRTGASDGAAFQYFFSRVHFFDVFTPTYWHTHWGALNSYVKDNFTWAYMALSGIGLVFAGFKHKTRFSRFLLGYAFALIPYFMLSSDLIRQHSYYQMPFLPLVAIASAYSFFIAGSLLKQLFNSKWAIYIPLILILLTIPSISAANDRVWNTQFYGHDVVGSYIEEHTQEGDRFWELGHAQSAGVCYYSKRYCVYTENLSKFKQGEQDFDIKYFYIFSPYLQQVQSNPELWEYVSNNYRINQVGLLQQGEQWAPYYFLLERGGTFNFEEVQNKQPVLVRTYENRHSRNLITYQTSEVPFYVIYNN